MISPTCAILNHKVALNLRKPYPNALPKYQGLHKDWLGIDKWLLLWLYNYGCFALLAMVLMLLCLVWTTMATYCYHDLENCLWFMMVILMVVVISVFIVIYDACVANMA